MFLGGILPKFLLCFNNTGLFRLQLLFFRRPQLSDALQFLYQTSYFGFLLLELLVQRVLFCKDGLVLVVEFLVVKQEGMKDIRADVHSILQGRKT